MISSGHFQFLFLLLLTGGREERRHSPDEMHRFPACHMGPLVRVTSLPRGPLVTRVSREGAEPDRRGWQVAGTSPSPALTTCQLAPSRLSAALGTTSAA